MIEAILRRISVGLVITTMLSELLEERARVFDRFDSCGPTRGSEEGGMIDQWGGRAERGTFYMRPCGDVATFSQLEGFSGETWAQWGTRSWDACSAVLFWCCDSVFLGSVRKRYR
jgi:hypothetical protein